MTIKGNDSSYNKPNAQQLAQARADGVRLWCLYIATRNDVGLASTAKRDDFERVRAAGMGVLAFVSGWDDPAALRQLANDWDVPICLDDEDGIRAGSGWQQRFLTLSGAGHYGNMSKLVGTIAPFKIVAAYPNALPVTPQSWPPGYTPPSVPHGWQCVGTHTEYGNSVDSGWYDDAFARFGQPAAAPSGQPVSEEEAMQDRLIFRGLVQLIMRITYGRAATQQEMDWWERHAEALGAGGAEFEFEEAFAGDDVIGQDYARAMAKLHQLVTGP